VKDFQITHPAQAMGTRARQFAMFIVHENPLLVFCDSRANHKGAPGVEFFRCLPTVWDDSVVPSAEMARHIVIARKSSDRR
jgi:alpha-glucosidase